MPALLERHEPSLVEPIAVAPTHPIKNSRFRRLWLGSAISLVGDQFYLVALPWVVLQITGSAVAMGTTDEEAARKLLPHATIRAMKSFAEAVMDVQHVARAVLHMAELPLDTNVLFMTIMATKMPFVGRG